MHHNILQMARWSIDSPSSNHKCLTGTLWVRHTIQTGLRRQVLLPQQSQTPSAGAWPPVQMWCFTRLHLPSFCLDELKIPPCWSPTARLTVQLSPNNRVIRSSEMGGAAVEEETVTTSWSRWTSLTEYNSLRCSHQISEMSCPVWFKIQALVIPLWTPSSVPATIRLGDSDTL